ncbi:hypothetical protein T439DRAFT_376272 [Meredithblackwellia eburnea MCA 4105]
MSLPIHDRRGSSTTTPVAAFKVLEPSHDGHTVILNLGQITRFVTTVLITITSLVVIVLVTVGSVKGVNAYKNLAFPHRDVHASKAVLKSPNSDSSVVRSYFGPARLKGGQVEDVTLHVQFWFREGKLDPELEPSLEQGDQEATKELWQHWERRESEREKQRRRTIGDQGFLVEELDHQNEWKEVWRTEMKGLKVDTSARTEVRKVRLPGEVLHSLVTNSMSQIVATFTLVPSHPLDMQLDDDGSAKTFTHSSTKPVERYGSSHAWPLPLSVPPSTFSAPHGLKGFLQHSSTGYHLLARVRDFRAERLAGNNNRKIINPADEREGIWESFLSNTTWVTMASDYSVYDVDGFAEAMIALRDYKERCAKSTWIWSDCYRSFSRDGHFENLLKVEDAGRSEWRYGPFITSRLSPRGLKTFVKLPSEASFQKVRPQEVKATDYTFDWQLTFSTLSPARLALAREQIEENIWNLNLLDSTSWAARQEDEQEILNSLLGFSNPKSRPIARGALGWLSGAMWYLTIPFIVHYWATRQTSAGIAIMTLTVQSVIDLISYIVITALNLGQRSVFIFVVVIISFVALILKQLYLCFRVEFDFTRIGVSGVAQTVPLPTGVKFWPRSAEEAKSISADARFPWWIRIIISIGTFLILRFFPAPPAIVSAPRFKDIVQGFGGAQHHDPTALEVIHFFNTFQSSAWLGSRLSQIHLNYRMKTFGGSYGIVAYLSFGSLLCFHMANLFVLWFGKPLVMQPFTLWDVLTLFVSGIVVLQARTLPRVDQTIVSDSKCNIGL